MIKTCISLVIIGFIVSSCTQESVIPSEVATVSAIVDEPTQTNATASSDKVVEAESFVERITFKRLQDSAQFGTKFIWGTVQLTATKPPEEIEVTYQVFNEFATKGGGELNYHRQSLKPTRDEKFKDVYTASLSLVPEPGWHRDKLTTTLYLVSAKIKFTAGVVEQTFPRLDENQVSLIQ